MKSFGGVAILCSAAVVAALGDPGSRHCAAGSPCYGAPAVHIPVTTYSMPVTTFRPVASAPLVLAVPVTAPANHSIDYYRSGPRRRRSHYVPGPPLFAPMAVPTAAPNILAYPTVSAATVYYAPRGFPVPAASHAYPPTTTYNVGR